MICRSHCRSEWRLLQLQVSCSFTRVVAVSTPKDVDSVTKLIKVFVIKRVIDLADHTIIDNDELRATIVARAYDPGDG
jgi:hypothetical protein